MSIPYAVAVTLVTGHAGLAEFLEPAVSDPLMLALARKVEVIADEELSALVPGKRPAVVELEIADGSKYSWRVDLPRGEPEKPLSDGELETKFIFLAGFGGKDNIDCRKIINAVKNVENIFSRLVPMLS